MEKEITYSTTNSYSTLNELSPKTKNVWIVLHGIGYLSRYFLKYFKELPPGENYIIAPQAPSKYYLNGEYKHVGSSWLTRENTTSGIKNVIHYLDNVYKAEKIPANCNLIVFGYSQGISIATRWVAKSMIKCNILVLYSGGIPNELTARDFEFLKDNNTEVIIVVGDNDEYLIGERLKVESTKIETLFKGNVRHIQFKGGHEVKKEIINNLV